MERYANPLGSFLTDSHGGRRAVAILAWHALRSMTGAFEPYRHVDWRRVSRLVFICKGNICRSPFAASRCQTLGIRAASAGLEADSGQSADPRATTVARRFGVEIGQHRSSHISDLCLEDTDLLVAFEPDHADRVRQLFAHASRVQVTLIGLWSAPPRMIYLHDPYGLPEAYFEHCFERIDRALHGLKRYWMQSMEASTT